MNWSTKLMLFVFGILLLCAGTFIIYKQIEISARQQAIETQMVAQKELADNIMRSMSQYATLKDIEKFASDSNVNLSVIEKDLSDLNANVTAINQMLVSSKGQHVTGGKSSGTTPNTNPTPIDLDNPDPYDYHKNRQVLELSEQFENTNVPIGNVGFSAWQEKPWDYNILPRQYNVTTVIGTDEEQRHYVYNKFAVNVDNKDYDIKIAQSKTLEEYPEAKLSLWNPRLYLGIDGGVNISNLRGEAAPSLNVSLASYGKYKTQPDLSILQLGVGYGIDSRKATAIITPIMYNVGKHIPMMNNLYIGPSVGINTTGDISVMGGVKVGL